MNPDCLKALKRGVRTDSPGATETLAGQLALVFPENHVLALKGDLGTGKTTFVRGLARAWGITQPITSPTFNLFVSYAGPDRNLVHLDAYRLDREDALDDLMIPDFLETPWAFVIEWPENLKGTDREWLEMAWNLSLDIHPSDSQHSFRLVIPEDQPGISRE